MGKVENYEEKDEIYDIKNKILDLESKLSEEKSDRIRYDLKKTLELIKHEYYNRTIRQEPSLEPRESFKFLSTNILPKVNDLKLIFTNIKEETLESQVCSEMQIVDCSEILIKDTVCFQSFQCINVHNSSIFCKSGQIRLINCTNINLSVQVRTGIYLQDSSNIRIKNISSENNQNFVVRDFNDPFGNSNYEIV